MYVVA